MIDKGNDLIIVNENNNQVNEDENCEKLIDKNELDFHEETDLLNKEIKNIIVKKIPVQLDSDDITREFEKKKFSNGIRKNSRNKNFVLEFFDSLITNFIIGPLVIGCWRGIWSLMDIYQLPNGWICCLTGAGLHWIFAILRESLHKTVAISWRNSNPIGRGAYRAVQLIYTWLFCVACIMQWRGIWDLSNDILPNDFRIAACIIYTAVLILMCLQSCRNILAPPFIILVDIPNQVFKFPTRYKKVSNLKIKI
ncbi:hypothetical protein PV327_009765 [Microctonus hyperodae]|uniref:Uncharacterized protein n=1 Tax=Microctonus hyperodae TaxID=165561 RepID=A0AA39F1Q4_MICHY|nr:hypothetical protein PV327_009765 [Microctonus hyperodae]